MPATRTASRSGRSRPRARARPAARRWPRRARGTLPRGRRVLILFGLAVALGAGLVVIFADPVEETIREVTLPLRHDDIIRQQAARRDLDPSLIAAVIYAESKFRDQTSHAGARGLMQITPGTADFIARQSGGIRFERSDLANPDINIRYGTFYLEYLLDRYDGNTVAAVAAYNAGHTNVDSWGGAALTREMIRFPETRNYVDEVLDKRREYRRHYARELGLKG